MSDCDPKTDQNSLDLKTLVEEFFKDFSDLAGQVLFIHSRTRTLYMADKNGVFTKSVDEPRSQLLIACGSFSEDVAVGQNSLTAAIGYSSLVVLNFDDAKTGNALVNRDEIINCCRFTFFHEAAHALVNQMRKTHKHIRKSASSQDLKRAEAYYRGTICNDDNVEAAHMNWSESVADVYATLMFRAKGLDLGREYQENLFSILMSYTQDYQDVMGHLTFFAIREAMSYSQEELSGKSPEDILALAIEIADQYSLTQQDIEALYGVFKKPSKTMHQFLGADLGSDKAQSLKQKFVDDIEAIANGAAVPEIRQIAIAMMKSMHNYGFFQSQEETQDHQKRIQVAETALRAGKAPAKKTLGDLARSLFKKKLKLSPAFKLWPEYQPQPAQIRVSPLQLKPE